MEEIVKTIKDNCYKETVGTGRDEELRYFMTEKDVIELAEELTKNHGVIGDVSNCQKCNGDKSLMVGDGKGGLKVIKCNDY